MRAEQDSISTLHFRYHHEQQQALRYCGDAGYECPETQGMADIPLVGAHDRLNYILFSLSLQAEHKLKYIDERILAGTCQVR